MRHIILDTETTGLSPKTGHRIIEIGCIEMVNYRLTGNHFHVYINPERDVPQKSTEITGLTEVFLKDKPVFKAITDDFLSFIGDDPLVIHNASFDMMFLNAELERLNKTQIEITRAIDTLVLARQKFPGSPASLDALCKRFAIDLSHRDKHGALIDAELLAHVYIELSGGKQHSLGMDFFDSEQAPVYNLHNAKALFPLRSFPPPPHEYERHKEFVASIQNALWGSVQA
jgi:DNA polymerase-3 subunit epsilon